MKPLLLILALFITMNNNYSADITKFLPSSFSKENWKMEDSIKIFKGDALFDYIDGGAEIYMEYGFIQTAATNYADNKTNHLQVEIYEMSDSAAAYGAYTFYLNGPGKNINAGDEAAIIDYYGISRKANWVTVVSTATPADSLMSAIEELLVEINKRIPQSSGIPHLVSMVRSAGIANDYIKYIEGNVGLSNIYKFIPGNAFKVKEGVSFKMLNSLVLIFKYKNDSDAKINFANSIKTILEKNKELQYTRNNDNFVFNDYKSNKVNCYLKKKYLVIAISKSDNEINVVIENVEKLL
jgi:hypothetical protein